MRRLNEGAKGDLPARGIAWQYNRDAAGNLCVARFFNYVSLSRLNPQCAIVPPNQCGFLKRLYPK
jgi:hypothetical protein